MAATDHSNPELRNDRSSTLLPLTGTDLPPTAGQHVNAAWAAQPAGSGSELSSPHLLVEGR